jgi:hypothetical protein
MIKVYLTLWPSEFSMTIMLFLENNLKLLHEKGFRQVVLYFSIHSRDCRLRKAKDVTLVPPKIQKPMIILNKCAHLKCLRLL